MRRFAVVSFLMLALIALAAPALAGVGVHAGLTVNPDDFLVGLHFQSRAVAERLSMVPSVEAGFGFLEAKLGLGDVPDWKFYVGGHLR